MPSDAAYGDLPEATTILGAAKITGKTASGWSVGLMEALTAREHADYVRTDGERGDTVVEPLANYFVGRARRDLRSGQTAVGAMLTAVNRRLDGTGLEHLLRSSAYAGGFDFKHEWAQRNWSLRGSLALSRISGSREVIEAAQRSSARYYQRPDADKLSPDTTATKLEGYAANLDLDKQAGLHWRGGIRLSSTSPGYEVNDLGFQTVADRHTAQAFLVYVEQRPGKRFRNWNLNPGVRFEWNYDGDLVDAQPYFSAFGLFANYWAGNVYLSRGLETLNDRRTRGGPLTRDPGSTSVSSFIGSDTRKKIKLNAFGYYAWSESGGHSYSVGPGLNIVPTANWSLSLTPRLFRSRTIAQYVQSVADATATETYGRRYIFADLAQTTLALETRLNLTFSPRFTLQLYAQPFLASGDYGHPKELAAPRSFEFHEYGRDAGTAQEVRGNDGSLQGFTVDPDGVGPAEGFFVPSLDFNFRSLRGNAVLRWEWRPGSTLFLVWQQRRSDYVPYLGDFRFGRDLEGLAHADDDNIFLLKINYWLNP
ncbi:MAG: hypothetical protein HY561_13030 [Gemmatimonadetes bacterium]|nr:hypothetical protein [Gemmatimonadota bacterium]